MNGTSEVFFFQYFFLSFSPPKKYMGKLCFSSVDLTNFANFLKNKLNSYDENF